MKGQALTSLLIIMFIGLSVISTFTGVLNNDLTSTTNILEANDAQVIAESGVEDALLQILRNPIYNGGTLPFTDIGFASISIASTNPFIFTSRGIVGQHQKSIRVTINNNNGIVTVTSWKEQ